MKKYKVQFAASYDDVANGFFRKGVAEIVTNGPEEIKEVLTSYFQVKDPQRFSIQLDKVQYLEEFKTDPEILLISFLEGDS